MPIIRLSKSLALRSAAGLGGLSDRLERVMPILLEAFGSAAAASIYLSPFYPLPDEHSAFDINPEAMHLDGDEIREDELAQS